MKAEDFALTRRQAIWTLAGAASTAAFARNSIYNPQLAAHTSLWLGEAGFRNKPPIDLREEAFAAIARAGYRRVELVSEFVKPDVREVSLALLRKFRLEPTVVSVSCAFHDSQTAKESRNRVLEIARPLREQGTRYVEFTPSAQLGGAPKSAAELEAQAYELNRMGQELRESGLDLLVHHDLAEMQDHARQWRFTVAHTEPQFVFFCIDVATAAGAGVAVPELIANSNGRVRSLHLRNIRHGVQQERLAEGDINLEEIAASLRQIMYDGLLVVELLYGKDTPRTRPLIADLSLSRLYVQQVFGSRPGHRPVDMGPHVRKRS